MSISCMLCRNLRPIQFSCHVIMPVWFAELAIFNMRHHIGYLSCNQCWSGLCSSVSALVSINEVNLRRSRLILGWVTGWPCLGSVSGVWDLSQYVTSHPGQLSLAISLWNGTMSTSQRLIMLCGLWSKGRYGSFVGGRQNCVIPSLHTGHIKRFRDGAL